MDIHYSELNNGIRLIKLSGKLDIVGANEIGIKYTGYCAGGKVYVLTDLSAVNFLASIGIRLLIQNAKSIAGRGGKMALINPVAEVKQILDLSGIPAIIPVYADVASACAGIVPEEHA